MGLELIPDIYIRDHIGPDNVERCLSAMGGSLELLFNLIFLGIAIAVFLKLRSVLGRRTGEERPPYDPYSAPEQGKTPPTGPDAKAGGANDKIIPLPGARQPRDQARDQTASAGQPNVAGLAPQGSPLAQSLTEIALADRSFNPGDFLSGARIAYEMIVTGFAAGDRKALRPLLDETVYRNFEAAIAEREARGLTVEQSFIGINKSDLIGASLKGRIARLTLKFVSELTSCTKTKDGVVIEGDPVTVRKVTDIWSFERDLTSRDPNWRLVATESPN